MTLLQKITDLMENAGDTVASLSRKTGLPYTTIDGLYKKGYAGARITTIQAIARAYGVSLDYLIRDEITDPRYGMGSPALTATEAELVDLFRQLNGDGQEMVLGAARNALEVGALRKEISTASAG